MARRAALTPETLAALGADRLARLILDEAAGNAPFKRIVTAALAGASGSDAVAALIDRRLTSLERARGRIGWEKRKAFVADLNAVLATIADELGGADPAAASERLLRFLGGAGAVLDRTDDASGSLIGLYERAAGRLPALLGRIDGRTAIVERLAPLLLADEVGLVDAAMRGSLPLLAAADLAALDRALDGAAKTRDGLAPIRRDRLLRMRKAIADAAGDVDAFIALEMQRPAAMRDDLDIAERLLAAGRTTEALAYARKPHRPGPRAATVLEVADGIYDDLEDELDEGSDAHWADGSAAVDAYAYRRVRLEIAILAARKEVEAAQRLRWAVFTVDLDAAVLRAFVAGLPDFEDEEALDRAFAHALADPRRHRALTFLLDWPRLDLAATLVLRRAAQWDGRHYRVLAPAADALQHDHPAAASALYRTLIDDILTRGRSPAYGHAARYLARLATLDGDPAAGNHRSYVDGLRRAHGRKHGFWSLVKE